MEKELYTGPEQSKQNLELDLSTEEWTARLAEAPVYAKKGTVEARITTEDEQLDTILADGTVETSRIVPQGDIIVTNPGGEQYAIEAAKFGARYEATAEEGVFRAKGMARAVENPTGQNIEIMAPWGEKQFGGPECMVATVFDPDNPNEVGSDRYIIGKDEFEETYGPIDEVLADEVSA